MGDDEEQDAPRGDGFLGMLKPDDSDDEAFEILSKAKLLASGFAIKLWTSREKSCPS
jgi:hypothetical protein